MSRQPYPSDISEEEGHFVAPYLTLMDANAPQCRHDLDLAELALPPRLAPFGLGRILWFRLSTCRGSLRNQLASLTSTRPSSTRAACARTDSSGCSRQAPVLRS